MSDIDIYYPPFPLPSDTPAKLHQRLHELYDWVEAYRDWANLMATELGWRPEVIGQRFLPEVARPSENVEVYFNISVPSMAAAWKSIRILRVKHDALVRQYEEDSRWGSDECIKGRLLLLKSAGGILSMAMLDDEKLEARMQTVMNEASAQITSAIKRTLKDIIEQEAINQGEQKDGETDNWWWQESDDKEEGDDLLGGQEYEEI